MLNIKRINIINKKLTPLRDKKIESAASLQKLNLDMSNLIEEESRVKNLQEKRRVVVLDEDSFEEKRNFTTSKFSLLVFHYKYLWH